MSESDQLGNEVKEQDSGYEVDATADSSVAEDFSINSFEKLNTRIWHEEEDIFKDLPEIPRGKPTR